MAMTSLALSEAAAKLELPRVFGEGVVVQRDKPAPVWGWGDPGDSITVGFNGQTKTTPVGGDGKWLLALDPMAVNAKPQALTVKGKQDAPTFANVLIGDVWLCSGQSNMESAAGGIINSDLDMPLAGIPTIRCLTLPLHSSPTPLDNFPIEERNPFYVSLKGVWRVSSPETAKDFPAVGYHFARIVTAITGVPIGLIDNSWGGSVVETWVSRASLEQIPEAKPLIAEFDAEAAAYNYEAELARKMAGWKNQAAKAEAAGKNAPDKPEAPKTYTYRQSYPGGCFNGLIEPIRKFAIKGAIFYQGEKQLRRRPGPAQPLSEMDITYDIPIMESWKKDGQRILLAFTQGSHPSSPFGMRVPPKGFGIAGQDRHFYPAQLDNVKGDTFSVTSAITTGTLARAGGVTVRFRNTRPACRLRTRTARRPGRTASIPRRRLRSNPRRDRR